MALFLQEATTHTEVNNKEIHELFQEGMDLAVEYGEINEAILTADFRLHEINRTLNEATVVLNESNFFSKAWKSIQAWIKKTWNWITTSFARVKAEVVSMYNRIKDRIKGDTVNVSKARLGEAEALIAGTEKLISNLEKLGSKTNKAGVEEVTKTIGEDFKSMESKISAASKEKGDTTVSKTYNQKVVVMMEKAATAAGKASNSVNKAADALDKRVMALAGKGKESDGLVTLKDMQETAAALRAATAAAQSLSSKVMSSALKAIKSIGKSGGKAEAEEKPAAEGKSEEAEAK
jgi:hypothetical protein